MSSWLQRVFGAPRQPARQAAPHGASWPPPHLPPHPWLILAVGRRGSGKTHFANAVLDSFDRSQGKTLAVDPVYVDRVHDSAKYVAGHADSWSPAPPLQLPPGTGLVVVDEADRYLPTAQGHRDSLLNDLVLRGRHMGCSLLLCTQRPALVAYDVRSQAGRIVVFRMTADHDLRAVSSVAPELRGREGELERLAVGRAVVWDAEHGCWPEK